MFILLRLSYDCSEYIFITVRTSPCYSIVMLLCIILLYNLYSYYSDWYIDFYIKNHTTATTSLAVNNEYDETSSASYIDDDDINKWYSHITHNNILSPYTTFTDDEEEDEWIFSIQDNKIGDVLLSRKDILICRSIKKAISVVIEKLVPDDNNSNINL